MSGWQTALDNKVDALDWLRSDLGRSYVEGFRADVYEKRGAGPAAAFYHATLNLDADLRRAVPMYIHPDIMDIAEEAVTSFRPEPLEPTDVITPWCFLSLPRPIFMPDRKGKRVAFSRFSWAPIVGRHPDGSTQNGLSIVTWATIDDWRQDDYAEGLDDLLLKATAQQKASFRISISHATSWYFGEEVPPEMAMGIGGDWYVYLQVLMRLSMQQITSHSYVDAPRGSWRRAQRLGLADERSVLVVKLRRALASHPHHERDVEWSHRWLVHGHWRAQWYPTLNTHRQIWIGDHVKGPEDKPLRIHAGRAFELVK